MRWFLCFLLFAALLGIVHSSPMLLQMRTFDDDTVITSDLVVRILLFLAGMLTWAIYLASLVVPWIAQLTVDLLYGVRGVRFPSSIYIKEDTEISKEEKTGDDGTESHED